MGFRQDQIILLGDSLTEYSWNNNGLANRLSAAYVRKLDVVNRGFGGYNSAWGSIILRKLLPKREEQANCPRIRLLVIWFGVNDSLDADYPLHVSLDRYTTEIEGMVALLHDPASPCYSPDTRIVLIGPPPIQRDRSQREIWDKFLDPPKKLDRDNDRLEQYASACKAVATKAGVPFVDTFHLFRNAAGSLDEAVLESFFVDGLHLAEPGYKVIVDEFLEVIKTEFPDLGPDTLPFSIPSSWDLVDHKDPESVLNQI